MTKRIFCNKCMPVGCPTCAANLEHAEFVELRERFAIAIVQSYDDVRGGTDIEVNWIDNGGERETIAQAAHDLATTCCEYWNKIDDTSK